MIATRELTAQQAAIVEASLDGPHVVDAGAGTGKTYTLVARARALVAAKALRPAEILIVTFMKKAAAEVGDRLTVAFAEIGETDVPACTTFHALAASLQREFAYETGDSPDFRAIDDFRARGVFVRAYDELLAGKLGVPLEAFPILERPDVLRRSLADAALELKNRGVSVDAFERDALAAAETMKTLPFGQLFTRGKRDPRTALDPKIELTPDERRCEGAAEAFNVRVAAALFRRFDELLLDEALLTYGDLLTRATAMLRDHARIAERLRTRWRHAMVDEFQDTNPQQLAFLRALFGDDLRPVMAVGDVRQAIFEWNGADPQGIVAIASGPGVTTFPLSQNRRSPQQILDAAYAALPPDAPYRGDPLTAHRGEAPHVALHHAAFAGKEKTADNREDEAEAVAREIERLLGNGTPVAEIAILLRARTHARIYSKALERRGIAAKTHGGVGFYDAPEIRDGVAWLRLIHDPTNAFALVRVLESPVVGLSHGAVALLFAGNTDAADRVLSDAAPGWMTPDEAARLARLRAVLQKLGAFGNLGAPDAVRAMVRETCVDVAQAAVDPVSAPQIRANVAKLTALATGFADERPLASLGDFLAEIDERLVLELDESEAELSGDEVSIMTIHSAKGLEWDHVFLANVAPSVFPSTGGRSDKMVEIVKRSGAFALSRDIDGGVPFRWLLREPHDPSTGERLRVKGTKPADEEERRLFYVALTRAKHALWVSGPYKTKPSDYLEIFRAFCSGRAAAEVETFDAPPVVEAIEAGARAADAVTVTRADAAGRDVSDRILQRLTRRDAPIEPVAMKLSYTAIATYATCPRQARYRYALRVPDLRPDATPEPDDAESETGARTKLDAATYGNIVHLALETIAQGRIDGAPMPLDEAVAGALRECECDRDDALRERVTQAISRAADVLATYEPIAAEAEFDVEIAGVPIGGFIDLIATDPNGDVVVIDYKTGRHPDEAYALQLALYCTAVAGAYPVARAAILRINDDAVVFASPSLASKTEIEQAVRDAATMGSDEPQPGVHCLSCPYAGPLCPEGAASGRYEISDVAPFR